MSIARLALRLATVQALKGRTWAGDRVRDSEIGALDDLDEDLPQPYVCVYTDDGSRDAPGLDLFGGMGSQSLVIEIAVTQRMIVTTPDGNAVEWRMPQTDAGMELTLDLIERQVLVALADPGNDWAEIWRQMITAIGARQSQRGQSGRDGMRFAGRQLTLPVQLLREPAPDSPRGPVWTAFLAKLAATQELAPIAPVITAAVDGGIEYDDYARLRATYGYSLPVAKAVMGEPVTGAEVTTRFSSTKPKQVEPVPGAPG